MKAYVETIWYHAATNQLGVLQVYYLGGATFEVEAQFDECPMPHVPNWLVAHGWERLGFL